MAVRKGKQRGHAAAPKDNEYTEIGKRLARHSIFQRRQHHVKYIDVEGIDFLIGLLRSDRPLAFSQRTLRTLLAAALELQKPPPPNRPKSTEHRRDDPRYLCTLSCEHAFAEVAKKTGRWPSPKERQAIIEEQVNWWLEVGEFRQWNRKRPPKRRLTVDNVLELLRQSAKRRLPVPDWVQRAKAELR